MEDPRENRMLMKARSSTACIKRKSLPLWLIEAKRKEILSYSLKNKLQDDSLNLTRPIRLAPHAPVAQKIADQRWLIANSAKKVLFDIKWCD